MPKTDDISKLDRDIRDAHIRKNTFLTNIEALTKEMNILNGQESILEDNLRGLKKRKVVAIAREYQIMKQELSVIKLKITNLRNSKEQYLKICDDLQSFMDRTNKELDKLRKMKDNNVIRFKR